MTNQALVVLLTVLLFLGLGTIDWKSLSISQGEPLFTTKEVFLSSLDWEYESPIYTASAPVFETRISTEEEIRNEILEIFSEGERIKPAEIVWKWKWLNLVFFIILALLLHQFVLKSPKMLSSKGN